MTPAVPPFCSNSDFIAKNSSAPQQQQLVNRRRHRRRNTRSHLLKTLLVTIARLTQPWQLLTPARQQVATTRL